MAIAPLILFSKSLDAGLAAGIEKFLAALLPRCLDLRRCDVERIRIFGDAEILLNGAPRAGGKRPMGAKTAAIFIRLKLDAHGRSASQFSMKEQAKPRISSAGTRYPSEKGAKARRLQTKVVAQRPPRAGQLPSSACGLCSSQKQKPIVPA